MKGLDTNLVPFKSRGFTLVEIMVASIIGAFVAIVAVGTLKAVSVSSETVNNNIDKAAEIRFAAKRVAADLVNVYRDKDSENTAFVGTIETGPQGDFVNLRFYTVNRSKARSGEPERDVYEVEYYLAKTEESSRFMRRLWPNPNKESEPGGILTAIADDIGMFGARYFDGQQWLLEWEEERGSLPELVEVTIGAEASSEKQAITESFFVNFVRSRGEEIEIFETDADETENR